MAELPCRVAQAARAWRKSSEEDGTWRLTGGVQRAPLVHTGEFFFLFLNKVLEQSLKNRNKVNSNSKNFQKICEGFFSRGEHFSNRPILHLRYSFQMANSNLKLTNPSN